MSLIVNVAVVCFVGMWAIILVLRQMRSRSIALFIVNKDPFNFVPEWALFTPSPLSIDLYLVVRVFDSSGTASEWIELRGPIPHRWWHPLFYPLLRSDKAMQEISGELIMFANDFPDKPFTEYKSYRLLDATVVGYIKKAQPHSYQFALMRTRQPDEIGEEFAVSVASDITTLNGAT